MRKRGIRAVSVLVMLCMLLACLVTSTAVRAETDEEAFQKEANMNLDVVFVLDSSGSMLTSDPNRVALDAFNLFVDLCDETCSVGYVVYSEKIKDFNDMTAITNQTSLERMKNKINSIQYDPHGDTDIALGLTKAMQLQSMYRSTDKSRKKVIILLSDGNTHLLNDQPRSEAESRKEMEATLATLAEKQIPVYPIGLNYDKTLDKKELENISSKTGGQTFETSKSSELPGIASEIFGDIYRLEGEPKKIVNGNVTINIKDSSVFYVNIIIRSNLTLTELDPQVTDPSGKKVDIYHNDDNLKVTGAGTYTLIKMIYPTPGDWNIKLRNATNDNCKVTQLDFYSIYIKQVVTDAIALGESVRIQASIHDHKGAVTDEDLLSTIKMSTTITDSEGKTFTVVLNREAGATYTAVYKPPAFGLYHLTTTAISEKFQKDSRSSSLTVQTAAEMDLRNSSSEPEEQEDKSNIWIMLAFLAGVFIFAAILVLIILWVKNKRHVKMPEFTATGYKGDPPPKKKKEEPEKPIVMPDAKDPDLVKYQIIEHDKLENLVRKGPEDAFAADADNIKADEELEKLVRKGADNPFAVGKDETAETDPSLDEAVKKDDDPFANFGGAEGLTVDDNDDGSAFGIKKDDDAFGGESGFGAEGLTIDDTAGNAASFGIRKDDDPFGGNSRFGAEGLTIDENAENAASFGIRKDDDVFGGDAGTGSGFADFGIKKDDTGFEDNSGSGFAGADDSTGSGFAD